MSLRGQGCHGLELPVQRQEGTSLRLVEVGLTCPWCHQEILRLGCILPGGFVSIEPCLPAVLSFEAPGVHAESLALFVCLFC